MIDILWWKFMQSIKDEIKKVHIIRLIKGEDIIPSIISYCKENTVNSGFIFGLGAVSKAKLGYYDLDQKTYLENNFDFNAEMLNCTGNISVNEETREYVPHIHMLIGDAKGTTYGGHVLPGTIISVTGEFVIFEIQSTITRKLDSEFNLFLLNLN